MRTHSQWQVDMGEFGKLSVKSADPFTLSEIGQKIEDALLEIKEIRNMCIDLKHKLDAIETKVDKALIQ